MSASITEVSQKGIEAWNNHDAEAIAASAGPNGVMFDPALGEVRGTEALKANAELYLNAFSDLKIEVTSEVVQGNTLCQEWKSSGTHDGELMGIAPTGKHVEAHGCNVATLDDSGSIELHRYWNPGEILAQIQG